MVNCRHSTFITGNCSYIYAAAEVSFLFVFGVFPMISIQQNSKNIPSTAAVLCERLCIIRVDQVRQLDIGQGRLGFLLFLFFCSGVGFFLSVLYRIIYIAHIIIITGEA